MTARLAFGPGDEVARDAIRELVSRWVPTEVFDGDGHSRGWVVVPEFATSQEARLAAQLLGLDIKEASR